LEVEEKDGAFKRPGLAVHNGKVVNP